MQEFTRYGAALGGGVGGSLNIREHLATAKCDRREAHTGALYNQNENGKQCEDRNISLCV
jgi:hypothetical protein